MSKSRPRNPRLVSAYRRLLLALPSSVSLSLQYLKAHHSLPNLRSPRTFSEKIQYRKLYDRDPRLPLLADKVLVKDYVEKKLGKRCLIPTLWSGRELPPRAERNWTPPYVVKTNHASGRNVFVKTEPDWDKLERWFASWLSQTWQPHEYQWLYGEIEPQLLIEPYIGELDAILIDYRFWVFGGRAEYIQVDIGHFPDRKRCFYDRNWNRQPFRLKYPVETRKIEKPAHLTEMMVAAETLAADISFVRVDLYDVDHPLFGEMTFYPASGFQRFTPRSWDAKFGELWPWP